VSADDTGEMEPQTLRSGVETPLNACAFKRPGYRFIGWNTQPDSSGEVFTDKQMVVLDVDTTLYAQWLALAVKARFRDSELDDGAGIQYTGEAIKPEVVATDAYTGETLAKDKDYTVGYENNVNVGEMAEVIVILKGFYAGVDAERLSFTIIAKPITVTAEDKTKVQGEDDPELIYKVKGLVTGDTLSGKLARERGEAPGTYKITRGTLSAGSNYRMQFVEGTLTITAKSTPTTRPSATLKPTRTPKPTEKPTEKPTAKPTVTPIATPTAKPTAKPIPVITIRPTAKPTEKPQHAQRDYTLLARLKNVGTKGTSLRLAWTKVSGADGYDVYFGSCSGRYSLYKTVSATTRSLRIDDLNRKESYKAYVVAWKRANGLREKVKITVK